MFITETAAESYKPVVKKKKRTGTTVQLDADILTKTGLAADRFFFFTTGELSSSCEDIDKCILLDVGVDASCFSAND